MELHGEDRRQRDPSHELLEFIANPNPNNFDDISVFPPLFTYLKYLYATAALHCGSQSEVLVGRKLTPNIPHCIFIYLHNLYPAKAADNLKYTWKNYIIKQLK